MKNTMAYILYSNLLSLFLTEQHLFEFSSIDAKTFLLQIIGVAYTKDSCKVPELLDVVDARRLAGYAGRSRGRALGRLGHRLRESTLTLHQIEGSHLGCCFYCNLV